MKRLRRRSAENGNDEPRPISDDDRQLHDQMCPSPHQSFHKDDIRDIDMPSGIQRSRRMVVWDDASQLGFVLSAAIESDIDRNFLFANDSFSNVRCFIFSCCIRPRAEYSGFLECEFEPTQYNGM